MKMVTVVGARPQFIKAAAISRCILQDFSEQIEEIIVHTGQHYDDNMSKSFFDHLDIPRPAYHLAISGTTHGDMTGRMLSAIEKVLIDEKPDCVLVYGDTNSTLAGALAAVKLFIPVAHVEAGLRSFNLKMPEEINRLLTDRISTTLFCPTLTAVHNLKQEGIKKGVYHSGDVMYDVALYYQSHQTKDDLLTQHNLIAGEYLLATCHREANTDCAIQLSNILEALSKLANESPVVFPLHPRTKERILRYGLNEYLKKLHVLPPLPYFELCALEKSAKVIITDSGGVQKEAFFYKVPCVTLREETEWIETVDLGWNQLVGTDPKKIYQAVQTAKPGKRDHFPYGNGQASQHIVKTLIEHTHAYSV